MGKSMDLTGQTFGKWEVLGYAEYRGKHSYWNCQCECGTKKDVRGHSLITGDNTQCRRCAHDAKDLTGKVFGEWTVLKRVENNGPSVRWLCRCSCGNEKVVYGNNLYGKKSSHCGGCLGGSSDHPLINIWQGMRARCNNPTNLAYRLYGGRGIKICERWEYFPNFVEDMGDRPSPNHSLDRIDNDGDYCPENCRWATKKTQAWNRRTNVLSLKDAREIRDRYDKEGVTLEYLGREYGVSRQTIWRAVREKCWAD